MSAHYKDLREVYAKRMEYHGNGYALLQPIASHDLSPPCVGYFDRNGDWTLLANLSADPALSHPDYTPLAYAPRRVAPMQISWQPKTSLGVTSAMVDSSAATPDGVVPGGAGADAHVKYATKSSFGAVLMTRNPVLLRAFNDERLFRAWLAANKAALAARHGPELRRYGAWLVTRTHSAGGASINAWCSDNRSALVSVKAKAAMLGELGQEVSGADSATDKDWCHYTANKGEEGLVLFLDGIDVKPREWWWECTKLALRGPPAPVPDRRQGQPTPHPAVPQGQEARPRYGFDGADDAEDTTDDEKKTWCHGEMARGHSATRRRPAPSTSKERPTTLVADHGWDVLQDAGMLQFGRAASLRRSSIAGSGRSHSLRRESQSVADEKERPSKGALDSGP